MGARAKRALDAYEASKAKRRAEIRLEPSRWKRFWKWCWFWFSHPFRWLWMSVHDWRTMLIFGSVFVVYSGSVWGFYLAAAIVGWGTDTGKWLAGIGTAVWAWWLVGPFSPFMELVILTTMGIKYLMDKLGGKKDGDNH